MANWQRTLRLNPEWEQAQEHEITISALAAVVAKRLKAIRSIDEQLDDERDEIVEEFEAMAADDEATANDFDDAMSRLYDWGNTPLDGEWNGKKACWIDTHSHVPFKATGAA